MPCRVPMFEVPGKPPKIYGGLHPAAVSFLIIIMILSGRFVRRRIRHTILGLWRRKLFLVRGKDYSVPVSSPLFNIPVTINSPSVVRASRMPHSASSKRWDIVVCTAKNS